MNFKFRIKRFIIRWNKLMNKKTKLLPDQQKVLENWTKLLHDKHAKPYFCRVHDTRVVALFEDVQETILRKMIILKNNSNGSDYYDLLYTEIKADGSKTIVDTEIDPQIARVFIQRFDEVTFRKILNFEKMRKNVMNESMNLSPEDLDELSKQNIDSLYKNGVQYMFNNDKITKVK